MKKDNIIDIIIYTAALCFLFMICWYLPKHSNAFLFEKETKIITVGRGETAVSFVRKLKQQGVVSSQKLTLLFLKASGVDKKLPVGTLKFHPGTSADLVAQLKTVRPEYYAVTIIPGKTLRENTKLNQLDLEKLKTELGNVENFPRGLAEKLSKDIVSRAVFLLPETYHLATGGNLENSIVREASKLWMERVGKEVLSFNAAKLLKYGIMASIVEGEARVAEDRPVLAGVFFKRLEKSMRLQSCATVVYCWKEIKGVKKSKLSYEDLKIESPYNTYTHDGLPPSPINIPSADSWEAVIHHADTDYLYFVADGTGKHLFSKTYSEHLQKQKGLAK